MENERESLWPKLNGFISFIPNVLKLSIKLDIALLPQNIIIGRCIVKDEKNILMSAVYEPDVPNLTVDERKSLVMNYYNCRDRRYYFKMIIIDRCIARICIKYFGNEKINHTYGRIDLKKQDESWYNFFQHVGLLGLEKDEKCGYSEF